MIVKSLLIILFVFLALFVIMPLLLGGIGFDIQSGGGGTGLDRGGSTLLFRSPDDGQNWDPPVFARERGDSRPAGILDVSSHPQDSKIIFAGAKSAGLWKSEDEGVTWHPLKDRSGSLDPEADVYKIAISRDRPEVVYLAAYQGSRGRVFRSEDGGGSFRQIYSVGRDRIGIFGLWTPPREPDKIIIATGEGRILASSDGGKRWRIVKTFRNPAALMAMHPTFSGIGYILTSGEELLGTYDGGENWAELDSTPGARAAGSRGIKYPHRRVSLFSFGSSLSSRPGPASLAIDTYNPAALWRASGSLLFSSADGGSSWREMRSFIDDQGVGLGGVAVHPNRADTIFVTAGNAFYTSTDRGINWSTDSFDTRSGLLEIFIHPLKPEIIFLTTGR